MVNRQPSDRHPPPDRPEFSRAGPARATGRGEEAGQARRWTAPRGRWRCSDNAASSPATDTMPSVRRICERGPGRASQPAPPHPHRLGCGHGEAARGSGDGGRQSWPRTALISSSGTSSISRRCRIFAVRRSALVPTLRAELHGLLPRCRVPPGRAQRAGLLRNSRDAIAMSGHCGV